MGYILPINQTQYQQYAERELRTEQNPFRFMPVDKVNNHLNTFQFYEDPRQSNPLNVKRNESSWNVQHKKYTREKAEQLYSELTGKGKKFNEVV